MRTSQGRKIVVFAPTTALYIWKQYTHSSRNCKRLHCAVIESNQQSTRMDYSRDPATKACPPCHPAVGDHGNRIAEIHRPVTGPARKGGRFQITGVAPAWHGIHQILVQGAAGRPLSGRAARATAAHRHRHRPGNRSLALLGGPRR